VTTNVPQLPTEKPTDVNAFYKTHCSKSHGNYMYHLL
jgi:hypothetical protein